MSTFGDTTQNETGETTRQNTSFGPVGRPPLRRAYNGRMIAGVCAGIADYLAIDVTLVRVAFAVFTFLGLAGVPAYIACLLLIPEEGAEQSIAASLLESVQRSL
jgi:phage shock protein PspC (stress-responsive transcriptional regulator)